MFILVNLNIGHKSVKMFLSLTFTFLILNPVWAPSPQSTEQELNPQITQLPALLNLAQTLSQASWGIQDSAFEDWVQDNPLDNSMETLRELLLSQNFIGPGGAKAVSKVLLNKKYITELALSVNGLFAEGAVALG